MSLWLERPGKLDGEVEQTDREIVGVVEKPGILYGKSGVFHSDDRPNGTDLFRDGRISHKLHGARVDEETERDIKKNDKVGGRKRKRFHH